MTDIPPNDSGAEVPAGTSLREVLARLEVVADAAGLDRASARTEGMALAATVAESARQAFVDWAEEVGEAPSAERFMTMAQQGRRWRGAPTTLLQELVQTRPAQAPAYAKVLADVCAAACTLGQPNPRVAGNAQAAAAAQLSAAGPVGAVPPADASPSVTDPAAPGSPYAQAPLSGDVLAGTGPQPPSRLDEYAGRAQDFAKQAPEVLRNVLDSLNSSVRRQQAEMGKQQQQQWPGSSLDLDFDTPLGPGAFAGLPGGPPLTAGPTAPTPGDAPAPANANAAGSADPYAAGVPEQPAPIATADQPDESTAEADAAPEPEPKTLEELLAELDALTGLTRVKEEIHKQAAVLRVEGLRAKQGLASPTVTRHLVFVGNPGTGKTTVARLVAGIYRALGLLSKGQLVEVDRSELVAGYLGQTAIKTAEVVKSAVGGVLFIDEAYSLSGDQYGTEAINTLVKEMEDKRDDLVVIVAGYPVPMAVFVAENPGLSSRFRTTIGFEDYTDDELVAIFTGMVDKADYDASPETIERFKEILADQERDSTFGNGRFARNCMEAAIGAHAWRLRDIDEPTLEDLRTLAPEDLDSMDFSDDDDELPDLAALQPRSDEPLVAPEDYDDIDDAVTFGDEPSVWSELQKPEVAEDAPAGKEAEESR
ncbi:AAA family ATPase [Ammonicoccus fulvus]|uniref:AAA family ATPase n=1 Tax=Ammonicoccus fulvus TaxID=3138240 RepID=A0ABZ3FR57_9ACTN